MTERSGAAFEAGIEAHGEADWALAAACFQEALDADLEAHGRWHPAVAESLRALGASQRKLGSAAEAADSLIAAAFVFERVAPEHQAQPLLEAAECFVDIQAMEQAWFCCHKASALAELHRGPQSEQAEWARARARELRSLRLKD